MPDKSKKKGKKGKKKKILKSSKKRRMVWWKKLLLFLVVLVVGYFGYQAWDTFNSIWAKNRTGQSPFLKFGEVEAGQLAGEGDGRINILLLGVPGGDHNGRNLSDTNIVLSIDPINNKAAMLSLPRDLWVEIPGNGSCKLNAAHAYGVNSGEEGAGPATAKETVSRIIDLPIHYYIRADFVGLEKFIDALGGIDVEVEKDIYDPYFPARNGQGFDPYRISAGEHHLDGREALRYARSRYTTSDFDRSRRQQKVLKVVKKKISELNLLAQPDKLFEIMDIAKNHLRTDLQPGEMKRLAQIVDKINTDEVGSKVLDNSSNGYLESTMINGASVLVPRAGDFSKIQSLAHRLFTEPYLKEEKAEIAVLNGTDISGLAGQTEEVLSDYGYNIVKMGDAPEGDYPETLIVDYTHGSKPHTLDLLRKRLAGVKLMEDGISKEEYDIVIVLGDNFEINDLYR